MAHACHTKWTYLVAPKTEHGALVKRDLRKGAKRDAHIVRACAVEMHTDISQGNFYARIYCKKAGGQRAYPDPTPAMNTYRKNPSVWTHCLGNKKIIYIYLIILYMKLDHKCVQSLSIAPGRAGVEVSEKRATVKNHALKEYDVRFT